MPRPGAWHWGDQGSAPRCPCSGWPADGGQVGPRSGGPGGSPFAPHLWRLLALCFRGDTRRKRREPAPRFRGRLGPQRVNAGVTSSASPNQEALLPEPEPCSCGLVPASLLPLVSDSASAPRPRWWHLPVVVTLLGLPGVSLCQPLLTSVVTESRRPWGPRWRPQTASLLPSVGLGHVGKLRPGPKSHQRAMAPRGRF